MRLSSVSVISTTLRPTRWYTLRNKSRRPRHGNGRVGGVLRRGDEATPSRIRRRFPRSRLAVHLGGEVRLGHPQLVSKIDAFARGRDA